MTKTGEMYPGPPLWSVPEKQYTKADLEAARREAFEAGWSAGYTAFGRQFQEGVVTDHETDFEKHLKSLEGGDG